MVEEKGVELLDFLYRDESRISSIVAQLSNGVVTTFKTGSISKSVRETGGELSLPVVAKGCVKHTDDEQQSIQNDINPHDSRIVDMLNGLNIALIETLPEKANGKLIIVSGRIFLRDFSNMKTMLEIFQSIPPSSLGTTQNATKQILNNAKAVVKNLPMISEIEIITDNGESLIGSIRPEYLTLTIDELSILHGVQMPGSWLIMGMLDKREFSNEVSSNQVRAGIDGMKTIYRTMYQHEAEFSIVPILIFREMNI